MLAAGFILFIASVVTFLVSIIWLIVALVSDNKASRKTALKVLVAAPLGLLISFPLCSLGFGHAKF